MRNFKLRSKSSFANNLQWQRKLKYLDLSGTDVELEDDTFSMMKHLEVLNLVNSISKPLPKNIFSSLIALQHLNISQNVLKSFNFAELENSKSLRTLTMKDCGIHKLMNWKLVKEILPNLTQISLHGNKFNCESLSDIINQWTKLNITVVGLNEIGESDFVAESCRAKGENFEDSEDDGSSFVLCFVGFLLLLMVGAGIYYREHVIDVVWKVLDIFKRETGNHQPMRSDNF
jgi:hypothetical protein